MVYDKKKNEGTGRKVNDKTKLKINGILVFDNIPKINYKVNGRTPLKLAIDRYKIKIDKESGTINDATKIDDKPIDIILLIERLVYVGVQSDRSISELPEKFEPDDWKPSYAGLDNYIDGPAQSRLM